MSRIGITKQAVKTAIDLLRSQGNPVTVRAVQAVTGGSFTTVSRLIDELKREEIELLGDGGQVKIELATLVESLHERLKADAMQRIQEGEDRCTARVQEIEGHLNEVKAAHKATLDELSVTTKLLETKEAELAKVTTLLNAANIELRGVSEALTHTKQSLDAEELKSQKLAGELKHAHDMRESFMTTANELRRQDQISFEHTLEAVRSDNRSLSENNLRLSAEVVSLNQQNGQHTADLIQLKDLIRKLENDIERAAALKQAGEHEAMQLRIELSSVKTHHAEVSRQLDLAYADRRRTEEALIEAKAELRSRNGDVERLAKQVAELTEKLASQSSTADDPT
ncbi:hypothetical protein G5B91_34195 (plasmid) [Pseudomonas nitroreducens]|uniref:KfrA N-terminal DNA-binding domain-containing protein n=1 Tax=Pseudomonas nitroreducens TaxID=46680 RepID=A0A6G6J868_PSENT|nr:DNA-binding protein [Pseudomonas nitroreducens]QIE91397.1 hypothetical protein G5B91_34195 [Pseudomonas nitroreducens]